MGRLSEVAPGVRVRAGGLYATTTTVIDGPGGCLVVDPAVTPADLADLVAELGALGMRAGRMVDSPALGSPAVVPGTGRRAEVCLAWCRSGRRGGRRR